MMLNRDSRQRSKRFPGWLIQPIKTDKVITEIKRLLCDLDVNTVCQGARCPNIYNCFSEKKCTFLILGKSCTRECRFCAIRTQKVLEPPRKEELFNIKKAVQALDMRDIIITSVTRDDLQDGGAGHFADCIAILRKMDINLNIEVLVPDFLGNRVSIKNIVLEKPDVFSHNIETIPRLYTKVRPGGDYKRSLDVLRYVRELDKGMLVKSGLMVGLGETIDEVYSVMEDLRENGCNLITVGQYLKPHRDCLDVERFIEPEEFSRFSKWAKDLGFEGFSCSPFTRSSRFSFN